MKILYINGKNADKFDKYNKKHPVFAKYFSPSCPACIAMENEWDEMCKDIENKYDTDLLLAQINPDGIKSLEKKNTYSDVSYVPSLILLKDGKKIDEYNGPKSKDKMIEFLLKSGYLKNKMNGGSKTLKKRKHTKKRSNKRKSKCKGRKGGGSIMSIERNGNNKKSTENGSDDFNFVENKGWLKPYLIALNNSYSEDHVVTVEDSESFAINSVDKVFRAKGLSTKPFWKYREDWIYCSNIDSREFDSNCRISPGFENRQVPSCRKFNPKFNNLKPLTDNKLKDQLLLAKQSYDYIRNMREIDIMLRTPSSDYTRFSNEGDELAGKNKRFMMKLRGIQRKQSVKDPYRALLYTYGYTKPATTKEAQDAIEDTKDLMKDTHSIIRERLSKEKELDPSLQEIMSKAMGGSKRKTKRGCKGKRNGTDGCRKCCKTKRKYNKCLKRCMHY